MKRLLAAGIAMGALFAASCATAEELWDPHRAGFDEGAEAGAPLPEGFYGTVNQWYGTLDSYDNSGHRTGYKVDALFVVPALIWQSGFKILGGDYSAAVVVPFDYTNIFGGARLASNGHGLYNTMLTPGQLAWRLPDNFYVKAGLTINIPDATNSFAHPPDGGAVGSGNGFWTVQPDLAVSWLRGGWNLSVSLHYAINLNDSKYHFDGGVYNYKSGDVIAADYTLTKKLGKWKVGVGGYSEDQITSDSGDGAIVVGCPAKGGCKAASYGGGPLVGYNFGGLYALAEYNFPIAAKSDFGGRLLNIHFVIPF